MSGCWTRVVKVGGSLLDFPGLVPKLRGWLATQPIATNILIAGGGPFAEAVRDLDARLGLGAEAAHWLCVEALRVSARLLASLLPESRLVTKFAELRQILSAEDGGRPLVFCPADFMKTVEPFVDEHPLPHTWAATSDSIAARLARLVSARELVLLKSCDPPAAGAGVSGYVDACFHQASVGIAQVRLANLRAET